LSNLEQTHFFLSLLFIRVLNLTRKFMNDLLFPTPIFETLFRIGLKFGFNFSAKNSRKSSFSVKIVLKLKEQQNEQYFKNKNLKLSNQLKT